MRRLSCPRLWEVEASRDGRLSGEELARFKEHCERCEACTVQRNELEGLVGALGRSMPDGLDPLSLRRLRQRVLESADATLARPSAMPAKRLVINATRHAVLVLSLGLCVFAIVHHIRSGRGALPSSPAATGVVVETKGDTEWREQHSVRSRRFMLQAGTLRLSITRIPGDQPVVVEVPDGELEDEGTTFSVRVEQGRTVSIAVEAGAVVFRRRSGTTLRVRAGHSWTNAEGAAEEPSSAAPMSGTARGSRDGAAPGFGLDSPGLDHPKPISSVRRTVGPTSARAAETATPAPAAPEPSGHDEARAVEAEEDLQYLRILALEREGRTREASLAAQEYLRRFPSGFRRVEAERIARRP